MMENLPEFLEDLFEKRLFANPRVKALSQRHGTVNIHELSDDLRDLASGLGLQGR